jgi:hypothetical protein
MNQELLQRGFRCRSTPARSRCRSPLKAGQGSFLRGLIHPHPHVGQFGAALDLQGRHVAQAGNRRSEEKYQAVLVQNLVSTTGRGREVHANEQPMLEPRQLSKRLAPALADEPSLPPVPLARFRYAEQYAPVLSLCPRGLRSPAAPPSAPPAPIPEGERCARAARTPPQSPIGD